MTNQEKYKKYLDAEDAKSILKLISNLLKEEQINFRPFIIKIQKEYCEWNYKDGHSDRKGSNRQVELIHETGVLVLSKKEFLKHFSRWFFRQNFDSFIQVMKIKRVEWLNKALLAENRFTYLQLMNIRSLGYFEPRIEDLVLKLANNSQQVFTPKILLKTLLKHPETLENHIWKIFQYESEINWSDGRYKTEQPWKNTFEYLIKNNKLDRFKVLEECLLTANRNFNKNLTGWFFDLFLFLKPTENELLGLQSSLFNALSSPQSKVVNGILKFFKKLGLHPAFQLQDFLDYSSVLLSSETKGIVKSTLMIFDKIATKNKKNRPNLAQQAAAALSSTHKDIQIRTAKLILKHGDPSNTDLLAEVSTYSTTLANEAKNILVDFLDDTLEETSEENLEIEIINVLSEDRKIPQLTSPDDFVFLASQVFDNNEAYHLEQFLSGIIQFQDSFQEEQFLEKLVPSFQRAYKTVLLNLSATQGFLDWHLALFMIDLSHTLIKLHPKESVGLEKLYQSELKKDLTRINRWKEKKENINRLAEGFFNQWHNKNPYTKPFIRKMNYILESFKSKTNLSQFVSMPTHSPFWIDPLVFSKRLKAIGENIDVKDFKLGIARLSLTDTKAAINFAKKNLSHPYKEVLCYAFGEETTYSGKDESGFFTQAYFNNPKIYEPFPALENAARLNKHIGNVHFEAITKKSENYLQVTFEEQKKQTTMVTQDAISLETYMSTDVMRIASLSPNNQESLFFEILKKIMYVDWVEAEEGRMLDAMGEVLFELANPIGETGHTFLAAAFLSENKTIRSFAAEFWLKETANERIDNQLLGQRIGQIESIEFCPLKRLTDLMNTQMTNISKKHSQDLEIMILSAIPNMSDKPIRNTKKLLDILLELRIDQSAILPPEAVTKLDMWKNVGSLKKIIKKLL